MFDSKKYHKEYNLKNKDKLNLQTKEYRENNKEKIKKYKKEYRQKNKEELRLEAREYYQNNKDKLKEQHKQYRQNNQNKIKEYRENNKEKYNKYHKIHYLDFKEKVYNHYSNYDIKCNCCGERHIEFLSIDHVNNNGAQHRKIIGTGSKLCKWLVENNFPEGYQILCMNCNHSRGRTNNPEGICIHQKERANLILNKSK